MPNPKLFSKHDRDIIVEKFSVIKSRNIMPIRDELKQTDRLEFENAVLSALGINDKLDSIISSLCSMQQARGTARSND